MDKLTEKDYMDAARSLKCEVEAVKAVAKVESKGSGFLPDGQVKILYEPHIFGRYTGYKFNKAHPDLSRSSWSRAAYGAGGQHQHDKLARAVVLDKEAALMSCSWGEFQVMGFNWKVCGYNNLQAFVNDMYTAQGQLRAFVGYVKGRGLADELQRRDWAGFALGYNGSGYRETKYDSKMEQEYNRLKGH